MHVPVLVCVLAAVRNNYQTDIHQNCWAGEGWAKEDIITCWSRFI